MCFIMKTYNFRLGLKLKKIDRVIEFYQSQWSTYDRLQHTKKNRNRDKYGKGLYKLINNAIYGKNMENLRNTIDVKLLNNETKLKWTSKPSYMSQKVFDNIQSRYVKVKLY